MASHAIAPRLAGLIADILLEPLLGGFFHDDQAALRVGSAEPLTPGYAAVRVPAAGLGIGLVLDGGQVVWGDAVSVQYAGAGGRDPLLGADALRDWDVRGLDVSSWVEATEAATAGLDHPALRYGISQALLAAAAAERGVTMAEVVVSELGLELVAEPVPLFVQSGEARHAAVERMIAKRVDVLPHGLFSTPQAFAGMLEFAAWVARRVGEHDGYAPVLHFDVYGQAGLAYDRDIDTVADFLLDVERACVPYAVRVESPVDFGSREAQIEGGIALRRAVAERGGTVAIVADEWCNTLADVEAFAAAGACDMAQIKTPDVGSLVDSARAVLACRAHGVGAYLGGSCSETEVSARACVHVAVATRPDMQLAKPGMGVDEAIMLAVNEQRRLLALLRRNRNR
jgi:methylaspartate ammonia-lyase